MSVKKSKSFIKTSNTISACIVAHNDEHQIERCLKSIAPVVDEIIIIHDGACRDQTLEIAKKYTKYVFVGKKYGYPEPHRVTGFEKAKGNWILVIDTDEFLSKSLQKNLRRLVDSGKADGYMFLWKFWNGKRYISQHWPHRIGIVRKSSLRFLAVLHPDWRIRGKSIDVPYHLEHRPAYDNCTWQSFATKWIRWLQLHAQQVLMPVDVIPQFQYDDSLYVRHIDWIKRYHFFVAPVIFFYFLIAGWLVIDSRDRWSLRKYVFFQALYYFLLALEVGRIKVGLVPKLKHEQTPKH